MSAEERLTVLLLGATGRTGGRVLRRLLDEKVKVRALIRNKNKLPAEALKDANLEVIEAAVADMTGAEFEKALEGCGAAISCLGHNISLKGIYGRPRDLVVCAAKKICEAAQTLKPSKPINFILMSSVSVHRKGASDARRGAFERGFLLALRAVLPPANDNQLAADFLLKKIGADNTFVRWTAVRPDTLLEGDVSPYETHEGIVSSLFKPEATNMSNVADFMAALATDNQTWLKWESKMPVIINAKKIADVF